ncbi:Chaperone DnaJ-domain superfamily protein [Zea mays]|uniref:Chaperone DnaJ-domain superfamily protein n=1 Tax=Zea mays TaxID=4577 RepID=A0A1D6KG71_MAIZE|nr:Chaperone DnaJ-domain superfamily protein [Zea mays]
MEDLGLWKQAWMWVLSQKHILAWAHTAACGSRERLAFLVDRHWPAVSRACATSSRLALAALRQWRGCTARGVLAVASLGPAAVFVILWSFFVCMTSPACALYALLSLGAAAAVVHYMGYTPGLFIVGLFGILIMWMYGYFWITGMLLVAGGCMCSLKHARYVIPVLTSYGVYSVAVRVGWLGVFLTLNLSFLTNDLLNKLVQGYEGSTEESQFEDMKDSDPVMDEFYRSCEFPSVPDSEPETVSCAKPYCSAPIQDVLHVQKEEPPSKVVKSDSTSLDEIKRIMDGSNHYEVLGVPRNRSIDQKTLKKEYHRMVLLVHPDKNMGNQLACESFKKLQTAYEASVWMFML